MDRHLRSLSPPDPGPEGPLRSWLDTLRSSLTRTLGPTPRAFPGMGPRPESVQERALDHSQSFEGVVRLDHNPLGLDQEGEAVYLGFHPGEDR